MLKIANQIFIGIPDAARLLGISPRTVCRLLDDGVIPFTKPRSHRRVKRADVLAYREQMTVGAEPISQLPPLRVDHFAD